MVTVAAQLQTCTGFPCLIRVYYGLKANKNQIEGSRNPLRKCEISGGVFIFAFFK